MTLNQPSRRQFVRLSAAALGAGRLGAAEENAAIVKAMEAVRKAIPVAESDSERPDYHFRPPAQWNNDPNGTIYYQGWHHLFYQHNPYDSVWGHMHWGHARSRDLVNWEHLPIALWPSLEKGEDHVFSGGAIAGPRGRPLLFYTSIGKRDPEQWLATPKDDELLVWGKYPGNPVLSLNHHGATKVYEWRDPFPFREAGRTFLVAGGNLDPRGSQASVQLYEAENAELTRWKYRGVLFRHPDKSAWNIECPNFFKVGKKWVLLISPHRPVEYFVGDFDAARGRFHPETQGVLDPGDSYASNISYDEKGRCILWLWGRTPRGRGWNSVMVMPRVLTIGADGHPRQNPAPEFAVLRGTERTVAPRRLDDQGVSLQDAASGKRLEIEAEFEFTSARSAGLRVRRSGDGSRSVEVSYSPGSGMVTVDRRRMFAGRDRKITLRAFLDKRVMEVYANDGAAAMFTAVEAGPEDTEVEMFAAGGTAEIRKLRAWAMKPAKFSLERFTTG